VRLGRRRAERPGRVDSGSVGALGRLSGHAVRVTDTSQLTTSPARELLRLLALGAAMAVGLEGWHLAPVVVRAVAMVQLEQVQGWALLLVVAVLAARVVPGVRWGAGVAGVIGVALTTVMAYAVDEVIRLGWATVGSHTGVQVTSLLLRVATAIAAGLVATMLLRGSAGGVLLPGRPAQPLAGVTGRVAVVATAGFLGFSLYFAASWADLMVGANASTRSFSGQGLRLTLPDVVVSIVVLAVLLRPARLGLPDAAFLVAAGVVGYPLSTLAMVVVRGVLPSGWFLWQTVAALAVGVGLAFWSARSNRHVDAAPFVSAG
jgi:hypothetical protein